ncbi:MAG: SCP2 sterol-binding domain-containing protein [Chloroflexi bacterium]|nr:SCP2 sterol-binding domain-containing protein [Chloroflexota bacterium]
MSIFATQAWLDDTAGLLNNDPEYAEEAKDYEGSYLYIIEADEVQPTPIYYFVDLYHGKCRKATIVNSPTDEKAEFEMSAPYSVWKKMLLGELDGNKALMTRKLKIKGNMAKLMKSTKPAAAYFKALMTLKTEFDK